MHYTSDFQTFLTMDGPLFPQVQLADLRTCHSKIYYIYKIPKFLCTPLFSNVSISSVTYKLQWTASNVSVMDVLALRCTDYRSRELLKTMQTTTIFGNPLADPLGTSCGLPLVRGPQFENRCITGLSDQVAVRMWSSVPGPQDLHLNHWNHSTSYHTVSHITCHTYHVWDICKINLAKNATFIHQLNSGLDYIKVEFPLKYSWFNSSTISLHWDKVLVVAFLQVLIQLAG